MYFKAPVLSLAKIIELVIDLKLSSLNLFDLRSSFSFLPMVTVCYLVPAYLAPAMARAETF
jgi:hypothetical protein